MVKVLEIPSCASLKGSLDTEDMEATAPWVSRPCIGLAPEKTFFLSLGLSALAGYETSNWGDKLLPDGSTLTGKDGFVYGGALTLELESYITDRVVFLINARERCLFGSSVGKFHTQFGIGLKIIM